MASQWPIVWSARWIWAADSVRRERQMVAESVPPRDAWNPASFQIGFGSFAFEAPQIAGVAGVDSGNITSQRDGYVRRSSGWVDGLEKNSIS